MAGWTRECQPVVHSQRRQHKSTRRGVSWLRTLTPTYNDFERYLTAMHSARSHRSTAFWWQTFLFSSPDKRPMLQLLLLLPGISDS